MNNIECPICGTNSVIFQETLQGYPVGNIYLTNFDEGRDYLKDFTLTQCFCGHLMGQSKIPSEIFYKENYPYLGTSKIVKERHKFGVSFVSRLSDQGEINNIIDIGCSSMNLLRNFKQRTKIQGSFVGIDPVPLNEIAEDIQFINDFFENSSFTLTNIYNTPNLILLDNVLEHIVDLREFLSKLIEWINVGDLVYICVPSLETMISKFRFEEISHEHVHYFSLTALHSLFSNFGFHLLLQSNEEVFSRGYNFLLFRFDGLLRASAVNTREDRTMHIDQMFEQFKRELRRVELPAKSQYWGVCASELTPAIAYFMGNSLDFLNAIFDTTDSKAEKYMPGVTAKILPWSRLVDVARSDSFYVTVPSLFNSVIPNLRSLGFRNFHSFAFNFN